MNEQNTDVNTAFKNKLIDQMDHISNISITTKDDPVLFTFFEEGGFMVEGNAFIEFTFRDPDRTRDRLISYAPIGEGGDDDE